MYRRINDALQVLLVHPGGPFWAKKDLGAWSIPKGEVEGGEDALEAARREFQEETGKTADGPFIPLEPIRQPGGKVVYAWACEGDWDPETLKSNTFSMEWPPRSGSIRQFPEVDRANWFEFESAKVKILPGQMGFLLELPGKLVP